MKLKDYIEQLERGGAAKLAKELGVSKSYLSQLASGAAPISPARCVEIEQLTNGVVTRKDMHPDDWQKIWPELDSPCSSTPTEFTPDENGKRKENRRKLKDRRSAKKG